MIGVLLQPRTFWTCPCCPKTLPTYANDVCIWTMLATIQEKLIHGMVFESQDENSHLLLERPGCQSAKMGRFQRIPIIIIIN